MNWMQKIKAIWSLLPVAHKFASDAVKESASPRGNEEKIVDGAMIGYCVVFLVTFSSIQHMDDALGHALICFEIALPMLAVSYIVTGRRFKGWAAIFEEPFREGADLPEFVGQVSFVLGLLFYLSDGNAGGLIFTASSVIAIVLWLGSGGRKALRKLKPLMKVAKEAYEQQQAQQAVTETTAQAQTVPASESEPAERAQSSESNNAADDGDLGTNRDDLSA